MNFSFGSSEKKERGEQTVLMPSPSAGETELSALNVELAKRQIQAMDQAASAQTAAEADPLTQLQRQIEQKATENIYSRLTGQAPVLSPEENARLETIYGAARSQGERSLNQFADQLAGMRGMRVTDSPIGGEVMRQRASLEEQLQGQKAGSALNLGQASADFNAQLMQFQNSLRQQAFMNRLALAGTAPASFGLQNQLFGQRLAAAPRSFSGSQGLSQFGYGLDAGSALSVAGGFMTGYGG